MRQTITSTSGARVQNVSMGDGWVELNGRRYETPKGASVKVVNGVIYVNGEQLKQQ